MKYLSGFGWKLCTTAGLFWLASYLVVISMLFTGDRWGCIIRSQLFSPLASMWR